MEARALGKGLSALIPEKVDNAKGEGVRVVKTASIRDNPRQPRVNYDQAKLAELVSSIKEKGVLQPILVRERNGGFEVIAGERRLKAARILGLEEIPVIIKKVDDQEALVLALVENIQREELNAIEEAQAFKKLIEEFAFTQETVAQSVGKNRSTISNLLRLLRLPSDIQQALFDGAISEGHARALLSVEDEGIQKQIFQYTVTRQLSVREVEKLVKEGLKPQHRREKIAGSREGALADLEAALQTTLGTKVSIVPKKKRGKIVIEYYSPEELKRIIGLFKK